MNEKKYKKKNMKKNEKKYEKKYEKKIYFKDIDIKHLKKNVIQNLKKKFNYKIKYNDLLLSNDGVYIFNNNNLKKFNFIINTLNETNNLIEINQYLKFDENCYKIPFEHSHIKIKEIIFNINDYFLTFEIIDDKINDFYIKINNSLNILDILMIKEISYIKTLLI